ncbi:MAG: hypothetical protein V3U87_10195 [Methylococcaceae bacterium]
MECKGQKASAPACELPKDGELDRWIDMSEINDYLIECDIVGATVPVEFMIKNNITEAYRKRVLALRQ